ncbi:hypothetical protein KP509_09G023500 [Ceratopteris richardii]|uniref:Polygalacturonase n=1 Tax=Ceratopteris richardii TaxID=49495 RepID=A0A8T2U5P7_CERRI|nr:hypothetical protein KP509_09G023500 [Ceratopteris richardii]
MHRVGSLGFLLLHLFLFPFCEPGIAHAVFDFEALSAAESCLNESSLPGRAHVLSIADFGAVGDGVTLNTRAFHDAVNQLASIHASLGGGTQLIIPPGRWLTGSFNLTSHFTLYLQKGAVLLASQVMQDWPVIDPLPSYGRGRERLGGRYISFIYGLELVDVIITGERGTIDGQGAPWWESWYNRTLMYTRGHLLEFVSSKKIIITNVVLQNSPFWTVHPVYCEDVIVKGVSIFAPQSAPNTDGIDPDSCTNVCIEDCYIENGDDLVSIKSGWDEYGIAVGLPSAGIIVRRVTGTGIRIKAAPGRGGYIKNVTFVDITMAKMLKAIDITMDAGEHPDDNFDPNALPIVRGLYFDNILGQNITSAGRFLGLKESPLQDLCMSRIALNLSSPGSWYCSYLEGEASSVDPLVCPNFQNSNGADCRVR